jgi:hypothetical protein
MLADSKHPINCKITDKPHKNIKALKITSIQERSCINERNAKSQKNVVG